MFYDDSLSSKVAIVNTPVTVSHNLYPCSRKYVCHFCTLHNQPGLRIYP